MLKASQFQGRSLHPATWGLLRRHSMFSVLGAAGRRVGLQRTSVGSQLPRRTAAGDVPRRGHIFSSGRQQLPKKAETLRVQGTEKQAGGGAAGDVDFKESRVDGHGEASRLHMLVDEGRLDEVQHLLQHGCDPNSMDFEWDSDRDSDGYPVENSDGDLGGMTLLHKAARIGNVECIRLLVQHGADVEARGPYNSTPLHLAAYYGHGAACKELVALGASFGSRDGRGHTPVVVAAVGFDHCGEGIRALVQLGASPDERDPMMQTTPLHAAALCGAVGQDRTLLELGAAVDAANTRGLCPLHLAAISTAPEALAVAQLLVQAGADVSARDSFGRAPLHYAAVRGKSPFIRFLLSSGADHEAKDNNGFAPAQLADLSGHADARSALVAARTQGSQGPSSLAGIPRHLVPRVYNPFIQPPKSGLSLDELSSLLQQGLHPDSLDHSKSCTLLQEAAIAGDVGAIRVLVHHGATLDCHGNPYGRTALHLAADCCHPAACRELFALGAKVNTRDNSRITPLMLAAGTDESGDCVRVLVQAGADIECTDALGMGALHYAVMAGLLGPAKVLLEAGAAMSGTMRAGMTAVHLAAASKSPNAGTMVRLLLAAGAAPSAAADKGLTPLHVAAVEGNVEVVRVLLQAGARADARDCEGRTPAQLAAQEGVVNAEVAKLLRQAV